MNIPRVYIPSIHIELGVQSTDRAQYLTIRHLQNPSTDKCSILHTGSKIKDQQILYSLYYSKLSFQEWVDMYVENPNQHT